MNRLSNTTVIYATCMKHANSHVIIIVNNFNIYKARNSQNFKHLSNYLLLSILLNIISYLSYLNFNIIKFIITYTCTIFLFKLNELRLYVFYSFCYIIFSTKMLDQNCRNSNRGCL